MTAVASAGDVQTFRLPRWVGMMALVGVVVFAAFLVLALASPFLPGRPAHPWILTITCGPVFGVFAWMSWAIWERRSEEVRTDASRITWCPRRDRCRTILWSEVVALRECALRQRLELTDLSRQRIPLEYQLTDFAQLRKIVRRNTPQLRERHALLSKFRRHALLRWQYLFTGLVFAGLTAAGLIKGELLAVAFGLGLVMFSVVGYGREIRSIDVGPTVLMLKAPFHSQVVPWREVSSIALLDVPARRGPVQTVRINLRVGKPIDLNMVAQGTIPLFDAVEAAWRRGGTELR